VQPRQFFSAEIGSKLFERSEFELIYVGSLLFLRNTGNQLPVPPAKTLNSSCHYEALTIETIMNNQRRALVGN
jgi:hypothetical protein